MEICGQYVQTIMVKRYKSPK